MIKTKRLYDPVEESDGDRILVTRYWPRGVSKKRLSITDWLQNLAPSKELVNDWKKQKILWEGYTLRYRWFSQCFQRRWHMTWTGPGPSNNYL